MFWGQVLGMSQGVGMKIFPNYFSASKRLLSKIQEGRRSYCYQNFQDIIFFQIYFQIRFQYLCLP